MWNTVGHDQQKRVLNQALESGSFSHAYLFSGPSRIGKKTLALEFARKILNESSSNFSPDLLVVENQDVRIERMRTLVSELSLKPFSHTHKVAIIDNFETATEEASNSILKTLEEPTPSSILILVTSNKAALLPTIISRCHVMYFSAVEGRIGDRIKSESDPVFKSELEGDIAELAKLQSMGRLQRLSSIKRFTEMETSRIEIMLERWIDAVISKMPEKPSLYETARALSIALDGIRHNYNKKLVFEKLFLNKII